MTDLSVYLARIDGAFPQLEVHSVKLISHPGQFNDLVLVNDEIVFRLPRYTHVAENMAGEVAALRLLAGRVNLPIPEPMYVNLAPGECFYGYRMLSGETLDRAAFASVAERAQREMARQIATFLRGMHAVSAPKAGAIQLVDDIGYYQVLMESIRAELYRFIRPEAVEAVESHYREAFPAEAESDFSPCLRHGDFGPGNILYDPKTSRVSGVIDFSSAALGDPALDLAAISTYGDGFMRYFCEVYHPSQAQAARMRFYRGLYALEEALSALRDGDSERFEASIAPYR